MEAIVPPDDPHRRVRLRVGCSAPGAPIGIVISNLPKSNGKSATIDAGEVYHLTQRGSEGRHKEPLRLLTSVRDRRQVFVSNGPLTYGLTFETKGLDATIETPEVQACDWDIVP